MAPATGFEVASIWGGTTKPMASSVRRETLEPFGWPGISAVRFQSSSPGTYGTPTNGVGERNAAGVLRRTQVPE